MNDLPLPAPLLLRGLTLTQPWAYCLAYGGKDVENRTWRPERQGGRVGMLLALHGGVIPGKNTEKRRQARRTLARALSVMQDTGTFSSTPEERATLAAGLFLPGEEQFFLPGIVAVARIAGVTRNNPSPWAMENHWHWALENLTVLPGAIPHQGAQGLWTPEPYAQALVLDRWNRARAQ